MEDIPLHILYEQLSALPLEDILNLCQINKEYNKICNDNYLWRLKIQREFPGVDLTWVNIPLRNLYINLYTENTKSVKVFLNNQYALNIRVNKNNHQEIFDKVGRLANELNQPYIILYTDDQGQSVTFQTQSGVYPPSQWRINNITNADVFTQFPPYNLTEADIRYKLNPSSFIEKAEQILYISNQSKTLAPGEQLNINDVPMSKGQLGDIANKFMNYLRQLLPNPTNLIQIE